MATRVAKRKNGRQLPSERQIISTLTDYPNLEATDKRMAKNMREAVLPQVRPRNPTQVPPKIPGVKNGAKQQKKKAQEIFRPAPPKLKGPMTAYLNSLGDPEGGNGVRCPINYNPVPSLLTSTARTTSTGQVSVAAATCTQWCAFPGHSPLLLQDDMDGTAYHTARQLINATDYIVGPMGDGTRAACGGFITTSLGVALATNVTNTAASVPMLWDVTLPYVTTGTDSGHARWKLVSMSLTLVNSTSVSNRGGQWASVQPSFNVGFVTQAGWTKDPTFRIFQDPVLDKMTITWIPKISDVAFFHVYTTGNTSELEAGILVWLNNYSASAQSISYQLVCNWELAGELLTAVASPTVLQPADKNVFEPAMDVLRFTEGTADAAPKIGRAIANTLAPWSGAAGAALGAGLSSAAKAIVSAML